MTRTPQQQFHALLGIHAVIQQEIKQDSRLTYNQSFLDSK